MKTIIVLLAALAIHPRYNLVEGRTVEADINGNLATIPIGKGRTTTAQLGEWRHATEEEIAEFKAQPETDTVEDDETEDDQNPPADGAGDTLTDKAPDDNSDADKTDALTGAATVDPAFTPPGDKVVAFDPAFDNSGQGDTDPVEIEQTPESEFEKTEQAPEETGPNDEADADADKANGATDTSEQETETTSAEETEQKGDPDAGSEGEQKQEGNEDL